MNEAKKQTLKLQIKSAEAAVNECRKAGKNANSARRAMWAAIRELKALESR